jgi:hypothetical protein
MFFAMWTAILFITAGHKKVERVLMPFAMRTALGSGNLGPDNGTAE